MSISKIDVLRTLQLPRFLIYGDSITEFSYNQFPMQTETPQFSLGAALSNAYARRIDILHRGFSGYNSEFSRYSLPKILSIEHDLQPEGSKIEIMTLFLGSNDAALGGPEKVELPRFAENMRFLIESVLSRGIKLILIGPLWHNLEWYHEVYPDDLAQGISRSTENNILYNEELKKLAREYKLAFIDLIEEMSKYNEKGDYNDLLYDGIHFSGAGYKLLFDSLMNTIATQFPECHPDNLTRRLPTWDNPQILDILKSIE